MKSPETAKSFQGRLGVCSWSLQPTDPANLAQQLKAIGLDRVQLDLDPLREQPAVWGRTKEVLAENKIQVVSGMFRTVGEDYTTPETIRRTGGVVPDGTWEQNWKNLQSTVKIAPQIGARLVTFHAGFLPHSPKDPAFTKLMQRVRQIARLFADNGLTLSFETGQETAQCLIEFLGQLNEPNVAVNFDPANMILYDKDDPIQALRQLGTRVKSCHVKDASRTKVPGNWGDEVPVGTGQVDWPAFFKTLAELKFKGDCCFEREAGNQRVEDIRAGRLFAEKVLAS